MYDSEDHDGKFPDQSPVEVRYPRSGRRYVTHASRCASWPYCATAARHRAGPPAVVCTTRAASGAARSSGRAPHPNGAASAARRRAGR
jgi:hypothetical protein